MNVKPWHPRETGAEHQDHLRQHPSVQRVHTYLSAHVWRYPKHLRAQMRRGFSHLHIKARRQAAAAPEELLESLLEVPKPPVAEVDAWSEYKEPEPAKKAALAVACSALVGFVLLRRRRH